MRLPVKEEQSSQKHVHHYKQTEYSFPLDHKDDNTAQILIIHI